MSVTQVLEQYQAILEEEIRDIAYETGAVKRGVKLDAATLVQMMIFGYRPRSRHPFKWIGTGGRQKGCQCDRIGD